MATQASILAWRIPQIEEPGELRCMGLHRVGPTELISEHTWLIISGVKQGDSAIYIYIYISILPQTPLPPKLPHNIGQGSLCCTVGPCWLSILNTVVYTCCSQTP